MKIGIWNGRKKALVVTGAVFLGISLLALLESFGVKERLTLADQMTPLSPDKYLRLLAALVALMTILYLGKEIFFPPDPGPRSGQAKFRDLAVATAIFIGYIASAAWLGYFLSTLFFYFLFLRFVGRYSYPRTLILSLIITFSFVLIFAKGLQVVLPPGILDF
jgi:hypothetical protein